MATLLSKRSICDVTKYTLTGNKFYSVNQCVLTYEILSRILGHKISKMSVLIISGVRKNCVVQIESCFVSIRLVFSNASYLMCSTYLCLLLPQSLLEFEKLSDWGI
jgi:hypothetical protein